MKIITGERAGGKTTQAIEHCLATGKALVVGDRQEADRIKRQNPKLEIYTYDQVLSNALPIRPQRDLFIDEIEWFLSRAIGHAHRVSGFTLNVMAAKYGR